MTMRTWMAIVSAAGLLALGSACVVTEGGTGGAGGTGSTSSSSSTSTSTSSSSGAAGGGGMAAMCYATCSEASTADKPVADVMICDASSQAQKDAFAALAKCTCDAAGACGAKCTPDYDDGTGKMVPNACAGGTPSADCAACFGDAMMGCGNEVNACTAAQ